MTSSTGQLTLDAKTWISLLPSLTILMIHEDWTFLSEPMTG